MTQRHFIALAAALARARPDFAEPAYRQWRHDVDAVAAVCATANPRFDRDRFVAACDAPLPYPGGAA